MKNFTCSICGKEFDNIDQYATHVAKCAEEHKKKEEDLQKLNDDLNRVKAAKAYYEDQLAKFKENYPEAYALNFGTKDKVCTKENTGEKPESKLNVTINGEKVPDDVCKEALDETLEELKSDPFIRHMINILGID